jgi:hypothetical protein
VSARGVEEKERKAAVAGDEAEGVHSPSYSKACNRRYGFGLLWWTPQIRLEMEES